MFEKLLFMGMLSFSFESIFSSQAASCFGPHKTGKEFQAAARRYDLINSLGIEHDDNQCMRPRSHTFDTSSLLAAKEEDVQAAREGLKYLQSFECRVNFKQYAQDFCVKVINFRVKMMPKLTVYKAVDIEETSTDSAVTAISLTSMKIEPSIDEPSPTSLSAVSTDKNNGYWEDAQDSDLFVTKKPASNIGAKVLIAAKKKRKPLVIDAEARKAALRRL